MRSLSEVERVDADLKATLAQRDRALDQLVDAFLAVMTCDNRVDVLLTRRAEVEAER